MKIKIRPKVKSYNLLKRMGLTESTKIGESKRNIVTKNIKPVKKYVQNNPTRRNVRKGCGGCSRRRSKGK